MRVVILVPRRADGGHRDRIWEWVADWLRRYHPDWPIYEGADDSDVFSMAKARNNAAREAGDWDAAVIVDADTIAYPSAVEAAVGRALRTGEIVVAGDMRMRMDTVSSRQILNGGLWFPRPEGERHPKDGVLKDMCYGEPSSGVVAIGRDLWDKTGGYVEALQGWGWEDLVLLTQCYVVGSRMSWVPASMLLHFWHPRTPEDANTRRNKQVWLKLHQLSCRDKAAAKNYLRALGHRW